MSDIEKINSGLPEARESAIEVEDVRAVIKMRSTLYNGGMAIGVGLFIGSFFAPTVPTMIFGICASIFSALWAGANMLAQKSILARATRLLSSECAARVLRVRLHKPPHTRGSSVVGSLYLLDKGEHRWIAQALGLHRLVSEQEVLFLEDENDPGFVVMKTQNGNCVLFLHPPLPGLPPTSEQNWLPKR